MSEELQRAVSAKPLCSIVIPVYNCDNLTRQCLAAVRQNTTDVSYEVVVVDDGSTDGTGELLAQLRPPFRSIRNEENLGFARSCNKGAMAARGEYILFLNNDAVALPVWLPPMIHCMQHHPDVGIVGSKLLYPENDLIQHAGLAFGENKRPYHIYRCFPSSIPEVNLERECRAVTGACFLVRKSLFVELHGFDVVFRNGFEDVDFCLRTKERGYKVWYCPSSVLYHYESMSQGRSDYSDSNVAAFYKRWADKVTPDPVSGRHLQILARSGQPLLKVNAIGDTFVMFVGRTLYLCDHHRRIIRTYNDSLLYGLARLYYSMRYCRYRSRIRALRKEANSGVRSDFSAFSQEDRCLHQFWLPCEASGSHVQVNVSTQTGHLTEGKATSRSRANRVS